MWLVRAQRKIFKIFSKFRDKSRAVQNQIRNMLIGNTEVNNEEDINNKIYLYYKNLFTRNSTYQNMTKNISNAISKFPQLSTEQISLECENCIRERTN